jgi:branched-chain amino acid transport system permease protein
MLSPAQRRTLGLALGAAAVVGLQLGCQAAGRTYYLTQLTMAAYYSLVALGLSLVMGYAGQVSLGHAAFFAVGGYTSAILTVTDFGAFASHGGGALLVRAGVLVARQDLYGAAIVTTAPWAAFLAALALTAVAAVAIGYPALRLKGHYLAMATLGFGLIVYRLLLAGRLTGGADGVTSVPPFPLGAGLAIGGDRALRVANYYVAWGLVLLVLLLLLNLVHSRVGRALRAIHEGETAAGAMGIPTGAYKFRAFLISALLASAAGSLLTHYNGGIGPSEAGAMKSVRYLALVAAGGMAHFPGVLAVSALLTFLSLRGCFGTLDSAVFGALLIAIVSLAPQGPLQPLGLWIRNRVRRLAGAGRAAHGAA